jgi:hypothetical protein
MTRLLGRALTPELLERFSQKALRSRLGVALPFVTVDGDGRPHPMLLSYLELRAYSPTTLGLVIQAPSHSASNLAERGTGTLLVLEPDAVVYVKTRVVDGPLPVEDADDLRLGYFLLEVEEVLQDEAADWEGAVRITSAVRYEPSPTLGERWATVTRRALEAPRARA